MKSFFLLSTAFVIAAASPLAAEPNATPATKPALGTFGVDQSGMDTATKPGDDFYTYVSGGWQQRTVIPADRASWSAFAVLSSLSDQRTRSVIEDASKSPGAPGSNNAKIGIVYASFMDADAIEARGAEPLKPDLAMIAAIASPADVTRVMATFNRQGLDMPIAIGVAQDLKDNTFYNVDVGQGGLAMPDRDYYLSDDAKFVETRAKFVAHVAAMLRLGGWPDPDAAARRIYDFEKSLATVQWTAVERRDVDKTYNPVATTALSSQAPGFDWSGMLAQSGVGNQSRVIVEEPSAITATARIIAATPLPVLRDYLAFHAIRDAAPYLSKAFVDENFAFEGAVLNGTPQLKDRWKRGVDVVSAELGEAVGQIYVDRYFPPEAKAKADALVKDVIAAMDVRLSRLTWMAPETKAKARAKLAAFTPKIGYPVKWRDYSALQVTAGDPLGNKRRAAVFEYDRNLHKIGRPVDRTEWAMTPQTVNAYADRSMNEIVFPAAILQPPFFDPRADPAVNYGAIGAVIGHELSHHFDDQGRKFDLHGNVADWWTAEDIKRFTAYTDRMVAQYGAYSPLPDMHVNGALTLGENMADLAGVNVAHDAWLMSLKGKPAPVIGGFTGEQRFFLGWAQIWQTKMRDAALRRSVTTDPHTPGALRPNAVRNLDAWYTAFAVKPGQKLYLAPADRIKIW